MTQTKYDALVRAVEQLLEQEEIELRHHIPAEHSHVTAAARALVEESPTAEDVSDGYHTPRELYRHRLVLTAALFNTWHTHRPELDPVKSRQHAYSDTDPMFEGYFIVVADLPGIGQVSYHYPLHAWDLFQIPEVEFAPAWDGGTSAQVADRVEQWATR